MVKLVDYLKALTIIVACNGILEIPIEYALIIGAIVYFAERYDSVNRRKNE